MSFGQMQSAQLEGNKVLKWIPLVVRYSAGAPSIVQNPVNEAVTLTDTGTGVLGVTLTVAGAAPLFVQALARPADPTTLGMEINLNGAATSSAFSLVCNSGADGATETDAVDIHILICKLELV